MKIKATIIEHAQGSEAWLAHRAKCLNASELAAAMGLSSYLSRSELIQQKATGLVPEVDAGTQRRFDNGHRFEAIAREWAEEIVGEDLYPVVLAAEVEGLPLSVSVDGLTISEEVIWEHKTLNEKLRTVLPDGLIPLEYHPQMEQGLMLSGASRCLFMTSNGDKETMLYAWYESNPELRAKIVPTWQQVQRDVANYTHAAAPVQAVGRTPETLPALRIEVTGHVTASNLIAFKEHALAVFEGINTDLATDQDFADAEKTVKWCGEVEDKLAAAKAHALGQTESIDALFKAIDDIAAEARAKRLELDKLVKQRKETIRQEILVEGQAELAAYIKTLNEKLGKNYMPTIPADFAGAMKGKKTVTSLRDAVQTVLANAKVEATAVAERIQANLTTLREFGKDHTFLFADTATIVLKANDDLTMLVKQRIADHQAAEDKKLEAERERIRSEEAAKAQVAQVVQQPVQEVVQPVQSVQAAPVQKQAVVKTDEMMTLGELKIKLAPIQITEDGLQSVGFAPAGTRMASKLYLVSDFPRICQALIEHLENTMQEVTA